MAPRGFLLVFAVVFAGVGVPAYAQQDDNNISAEINKNLEKQIESIRENMERAVVKEGDDERKAASLLEEVRTLDKQLLKAGRRTEELRVQEAQLEAEYGELSERVNQIDEERARRRSILVQRLSSIYRRGRVGSTRAMLQAAASAEPIRMARYLAAISQSDGAAVRGYEESSHAYAMALADMEKQQVASAATRAALERANAEYERTRASKAKTLTRVKAEMAARKIELRRLKATEDALRKILAEAPPPPKPAPVRVARRTEPASARTPFGARKGTMAPPVYGRLLRGFGADDGHGVKAKGIVVAADLDRRVFAIAAGEIVFAGPFPGLGNTVVINHGDRYHSVYAHLDRIFTEVGGVVPAGRSIGSLDSRDGQLHFEIRAEGKAVDPVAWFDRGKDAFRR